MHMLSYEISWETLTKTPSSVLARNKYKKLPIKCKEIVGSIVVISEL